MKRHPAAWWTWFCLLPLALAVAARADDPIQDAKTARELFRSPPRAYSTAPLWVWNDALTEDQVRTTLRDLRAQQVRQVFVHPRPGLMTPYLSEAWFDLVGAALDEAERLDMNVWIYDENSYPSGFAGGHVPERMPEARGRGLILREADTLDGIAEDLLAVYQLRNGGFANVTETVRSGGSPAGRFVVASVARSRNSPWHGDRCYVDLMYPGVTETFLDVTLGAYEKHFGAQFGKRIPGSFTDEPNVRPAGGLPWTDHLPAAFRERWGDDLLEHLPSLTRPTGDWKRVRHDYYQVVLEQFIEHWAKPYASYCERKGIAFTGHYWDHEWPNCVGVTDNMAMSAWQQIPGIDCLMNQYREDTHAQFGNVRFVKEVRSVANQLGRERVLCEAYGAAGWDLGFEDMKRIGDWLGVLGVNLFDEHLSYVTLRGARKTDHPQSFSYHEPWWDSYHVIASYLTRLSAAMSMGTQRNRILVIEPTTTAWMYQADATQASTLSAIGDTFFDLLYDLEMAQVEYDIGCEDVMARHASVRPAPSHDRENAGLKNRAVLVVGQAQYDTVVLPQLTETLRSETVTLLEAFVRGGGTVLALGEPPPARVDGRPSDRIANLQGEPTWQRSTADRVPARLAPTLAKDGFAIHREPTDEGILFHHRRELRDGDLLLLVNTSMTAPARGRVQARARGVEAWDLFTGETHPHAFSLAGDHVEFAFEIPPCGSRLVLLSDEPRTPTSPSTDHESSTKTSVITVERLEPNVLTLDFVDVTIGGETRRGVYYHAAGQWVWQQHGLPRSPWDGAVQFEDERIRTTFPKDSGFEVSYRFTIEGTPPTPLHVVIEHPELYTVTCNGTHLDTRSEAWWLDRAFLELDISEAVHPGENVVTLAAHPLTVYHEIAPAYVRGDFSLRPAEEGFVIVPPSDLEIAMGVAHTTDLEGASWLSAGLGYHRTPEEHGNDGAPEIVFDLGHAVDLVAIDVWNYNEATLPGRGVKTMRVTTALDLTVPDAWTAPPLEVELLMAPGGAVGAATAIEERIPIGMRKARYVKFTILANHQGTTFPTTDAGHDNAFVGLSEVRFEAAGESGDVARVAGVTIHAVSSELVESSGHDRRADHLIDGSGLTLTGIGWDRQGMPFYPGSVSYRGTLVIRGADELERRHRVAVPRWNGSVAQVLVDGKLMGHLVSRPWEVDITKALHVGENVIDVRVTGSLANLLGPHHDGSAAGSAWPAMFRHAPATGPPPGRAYRTSSYGLFEPFVLHHSTR